MFDPASYKANRMPRSQGAVAATVVLAGSESLRIMKAMLFSGDQPS
jgi:hypothetical protein